MAYSLETDSFLSTLIRSEKKKRSPGDDLQRQRNEELLTLEDGPAKNHRELVSPTRQVDF